MSMIDEAEFSVAISNPSFDFRTVVFCSVLPYQVATIQQNLAASSDALYQKFAVRRRDYRVVTPREHQHRRFYLRKDLFQGRKFLWV
jgi:hypothetical protein